MRRIKKASKKDLKTNLLLLGISLLISLFIGEFFLRALGYYGVRVGKGGGTKVLVEDDILDYRLITNQSWIANNIRFSTNKHGWIDDNYDYKKSKNTFRILVLGDSVTISNNKLEDLYAKQLEKRLNQNQSSNIKYEVITIALSGLNTEQEAHLFEIEGIKYDPDLLIIGYVLNDPENGVSLKKWRLVLKNKSFFYKLKKIGQKSSLIHYTYRSAQKIYWKIAIAVGKEQTADYIYDDYFSSLHKDPDKWSRVVKSFEKVNTLSKQNNIPIILMIFPVFYKLEDYQWTAIHKKVTDAALQNDFKVLDLLGYYQKYKQSDLQVANGDHVHPNKLGHQIASEVLYEFLLNNGFLPLKHR